MCSSDLEDADDAAADVLREFVPEFATELVEVVTEEEDDDDAARCGCALFVLVLDAEPLMMK